MQFLVIIGMAMGWGVLRNYHAHAKEMGSEPSTVPLFFFMPPASLLSFESGFGEIDHPNPECTIHHEVELVFRIGQNGRPDAVCIGLDPTNRTEQKLQNEMVCHGVMRKASKFSTPWPMECLQFWRIQSATIR